MQYWPLGSTTDYRPPAALCTADHSPLSSDSQFSTHLIVHSSTCASWASWEDVMGDSVKKPCRSPGRQHPLLFPHLPTQAFHNRRLSYSSCLVPMLHALVYKHCREVIEHAGLPEGVQENYHNHTHIPPWGGWPLGSCLWRQLGNICHCSDWPSLFPNWMQLCEHCHFGSHAQGPSF